MTRISAFGDDALGDHDAVGLVDALRAGEVSAAELVEAAIARTEAVQPTLNGLAYEAFDRARKRANAPRPYGGYFDGVPSYLKDNVDVAGMPTMQGTDAWEPRPARADGAFARVFFATGLSALGKTQMSEFGFSASAEHPRIGPVRNPWNPDLTAGASSSGAGAFVAAGVVPIAHANDGAGSIRIPAAVNGLVGLKTTRGRLPLDEQAARMPLHLVPMACSAGLCGTLRRSFARPNARTATRSCLPLGMSPTLEATTSNRILHEIRCARGKPGVSGADVEDSGSARGTRAPGHRDQTTRCPPISTTTSCSTGSS